jgi:RNA polymerase sigma-70 factor (ECF subfamily)
VFRESSTQVWRGVVAITAGRTDIADDVTAEAFARAYAHAERLRDPLAWTFRTAFRLAISELRSERRRLTSAMTMAGNVASADMSPRFRELLAQLSPKQRAAVFLHYHADLPVKEVARLMGTTQPTARVHLHRARAHLRVLLETERQRG